MTDLNIQKFETRELLINALSKVAIAGLSKGINDRGVASMLLSGGTTPGPMYEKMSNQQLDWNKVWFAPTDERWVEPDHKDSNEKLIRDTLLQNNAKVANYIGLKSAHDNPYTGQADSDNAISKLPRPFDIVLLGMGEDGHCASLFPGLEDTMNALSSDALCGPIKRGGNEVDRMSMTLNCLLSAKHVILLFFGNKKLEVFEKACAKRTDQLPVSYILNQDKVPVSLYWAE